MGHLFFGFVGGYPIWSLTGVPLLTGVTTWIFCPISPWSSEMIYNQQLRSLRSCYYMCTQDRAIKSDYFKWHIQHNSTDGLSTNLNVEWMSKWLMKYDHVRMYCECIKLNSSHAVEHCVINSINTINPSTRLNMLVIIKWKNALVLHPLLIQCLRLHHI